MDETASGEANTVEPGWHSDPEDRKGKWLRYWDGDSWSDAPARLASAEERERLQWPLAPKPSLDDRVIVELRDVLLLGGYGYPLVPETSFDLEFGAGEAVVTGPGSNGVETVSIPYDELTNLSIEGPGVIEEGGGFIGGGAVDDGFAVGVAVAGVLNALGTRHRIETLVGLQTERGELVFLCTTVDPPTLELKLSRPRATVRDRSARNKTTQSIGAELSRLADLVERGFLEREEYDELKKRLLES